MTEAPNAVAALRSPATRLPCAESDPRTHRCFQIRFEVLSGDAALAAFTDIELENLNPALSSSAIGNHFSYRGLEITGDLSLVRETQLDKNSFISIELEVPGYWHTLRCVGSVSWLREDASQGYFKAGVSFLNVKRQNLGFIQAAMDKFVG